MTKYNSGSHNSKSSKLLSKAVNSEDISIDQLLLVHEENELIKQLYADLEQAELMLEESNNILIEQVKKLSDDLIDAEIELSETNAKLEQAIFDLESAKDISESDREIVEEYKLQLITLSNDLSEQTELLEKLESDNDQKTKQFEQASALSNSLLKEVDDQKIFVEKLKASYSDNMNELKEKFAAEKLELNESLNHYKFNFEKNEKQLEQLTEEFEDISREYLHYEKITNDKIDESQKLIRSLEENLGKAQQERLTIQDTIYNIEKQLHDSEASYIRKMKEMSNDHKNEITVLKDDYNSKVRSYEARIEDLHLALKSSEDMKQIINEKLHEHNIKYQKLADQLNHKEELIAKFEDDKKELAHALKIKDNDLLDLKYEHDRIKNEHRSNIEELKNKINEGGKRIFALESINKDLDLKFQKFKKQATEEKEQLKAVIHDQTHEINNLDKENFVLSESIEEIRNTAKYEGQKQYEIFQKDLLEIRDSNDKIKQNLQGQYDDLYANFTSLKQADEKMKLKIQKQQKLIGDFERKLNAKNNEIEKLEIEKSDIKQQLVQAHKFDVNSKLELHELNAKLNDHKDLKFVFEQSNQKLVKELNIYKAEIEKLNTNLDKKDLNISNLKSENSKLIQQLESLQKEIKILDSHVKIEKQRFHKADNVSNATPQDVYYHLQEIQRVKLSAVAKIDEADLAKIPTELQEPFKELRRMHKLKVGSIIMAYEASVSALQMKNMEIKDYETAMRNLTYTNAANLVMLEEEYLAKEQKLFEGYIN